MPLSLENIPGRGLGCPEVLPLVTHGNIDHSENASVIPAPHTDTCPLLYSPIFTRFG
ncbi:hypothetical protein M419DRAFT_128840 [Trichoderma reesei RUT C-30]|uniref:Uncharacterized protein n=1 Tax=Hypocrea jecorina (strain ATCC 56765 / BCRC 32924 / NRRL 11460 / Rut C-30) TaxID=1344414 RepID=A0A024SEP9_HYPJR|nr:hypothetical protein M419DRAFT_128840 [Trichoderma reesei RUT C-30]